jgi:phosphoribosylformylglycinamidine (FGAM) synthase PurS component
MVIEDMSEIKLEIGVKSGFPDVFGNALKQKIEADLGISLKKIQCLNVFNFQTDLLAQELNHVAKSLLIDPVLEHYAIGKDLYSKFAWQITVELHANMDDTLGEIAMTGIKDLGISLNEEARIRTAKKYLLYGKLSKSQVTEIAEKILANVMIENYVVEKGGK